MIKYLDYNSEQGLLNQIFHYCLILQSSQQKSQILIPIFLRKFLDNIGYVMVAISVDLCRFEVNVNIYCESLTFMKCLNLCIYLPHTSLIFEL